MIEALRSENNAYDKKIAFVEIDSDQHRSSPISKEYKVYRQSTLVIVTGEGEAGRLLARTEKATIKDLLDKGLKATPVGSKPCTG